MCFMINNDPKPISVHQLIAEIKEYLELQRDLLKVEGVEKLTILISAFLVLMITSNPQLSSSASFLRLNVLSSLN